MKKVFQDINEVHKNQGSIKSVPAHKPALEIQNKKKSVKCPYCKCGVKESYLQSHIDKDHPPLKIAMKEHEQAKVGKPEKLIYVTCPQ